MRIEYSVTVEFIDDGVIPYTHYSGAFKTETAMSDVEVKSAVMADVKMKLTHTIGKTYEELMADKRFIGLRAYAIEVCKSVDSTGCYIDGPAKSKK